MSIAVFPHCDARVLHAPGECEYCDGHPEWQELRHAWGIAFTGHVPLALQPECGERFDAYGKKERCRQASGHPRGGPHDGHHWGPEREMMPCPADAARPQGSGADHRRWAGNKPTGAVGDPAWPAESASSVMMYGDKGGREPWPERARRRFWPLSRRS